MKHAGGLASLASLVVVACAHNVPQDIASGPDKNKDGAEPIQLENGEGLAKGIVTYPGGDRVDWKSIELPEGKKGTLELKLSWTAPRPGLRVAMDVFDQWATPIAVSNAALHVKGRSRETKIDHAKGTYFVRVFAPRRGDAGTYKLQVDFQEEVPPPPLPKVEVPDPPRLAAVPPPVEECLNFDAHNPDCADKCPNGAPPTWGGCAKTCMTNDPNLPVCQKTMPCPKPADTRVADCVRSKRAIEINFPACNWNAPDEGNPRCDPSLMPPVRSRLIAIEEQGDVFVVTVALSADEHVGKDWVIHVLSGESDTPLPGGSGKIYQLSKTQAKAKVHVKRDLLDKNQRVLVSPQ